MSHQVIRCFLACCALALSLAANSAQAQFADLEGQIVLDGDLPALKNKVEKGDAAAKDPSVCAAEAIPYYNLTINPANKGIADVFVYIRKATTIDPKLAAAPTTELVVDQKNCTFIPHAMVVRTGQQVVAKSQDAVPHNIHGYNVFNPGFNFTVGANDREGQKVPVDKANAKAEPLPIGVKCDIHTHMESYWLVIDHPYAAVTDAYGKFKIVGMPVGKHKITIWHSTAGYIAKTLDVEVKKDGTVMEPLKVKSEKSGDVAKLKAIQ
jgi:plastocyanin